MTALPQPQLRLGQPPAQWVWSAGDGDLNVNDPGTGAIPAGVLLDHGDHTLLVAWVPAFAAAPFTLESLLPLTVRELVACPTCGSAGHVSGGAWLPTREVSRG